MVQNAPSSLSTAHLLNLPAARRVCSGDCSSGCPFQVFQNVQKVTGDCSGSSPFFSIFHSFQNTYLFPTAPASLHLFRYSRASSAFRSRHSNFKTLKQMGFCERVGKTMGPARQGPSYLRADLFRQLHSWRVSRRFAGHTFVTRGRRKNSSIGRRWGVAPPLAVPRACVRSTPRLWRASA